MHPMNRLSRTALAALIVGLAAGPALAADEGFGVPADYRVSMDRVETCHKAILAVTRQAQSDSALKAEMQAFGAEDESDPDVKTVAWLTKEMKTKAPAASRLMEKQGCGPEVFWTSTLATIEAGLHMAMQQMGGPAPDLTAAQKANVETVSKNQARLEQIGQEQARATQELGLDGE